MAKARRKRTRLDDNGQRNVVVRVDAVIYILAGVIALLALGSLIFPERVEAALIVSLGTTLIAVLAGWFAYMRLTQRDDGDETDEGDNTGETRPPADKAE